MAHEVDAAMSWVVLCLPVPAPEKVVSDPLVPEIEVCIGALGEGEIKSRQERIAKMHRRDTVETGNSGIKGGCLLIVFSMQRNNTNRTKNAVLLAAEGKRPGRFGYSSRRYEPRQLTISNSDAYGLNRRTGDMEPAFRY